jgi:hypothetical protein
MKEFVCLQRVDETIDFVEGGLIDIARRPMFGCDLHIVMKGGTHRLYKQ